MQAKVLLVGGAPLSGKTTLAARMATRLDWDHLHGDDLARAARALAPAPLRAVLDYMAGHDWRDYYLAKSLNEQLEGALAAHRAVWPAIEAIVEARLTWGRPAVIDWWGLIPEIVVASKHARSPSVRALWLHVPGDVFASRLEREPGFYRGARDERGLIAAFAVRSQAFNDLYRAEALKQGCSVLGAAPAESVEALADRAIALISNS